MARFRLTTQGVNAAIDYTSPPVGMERLLTTIYVHSVVASGTAESLTVTLDSGRGSNYDTVLITKDLNGVTDYFVADINAPLEPDDRLKVAYTNTDSETVSVLLVLE